MSQFKATVDPSPKERTGAPSASPEARLEDYLEDRGASPETVESLALESDHVAPDGKRFVKFEQRIDDLRVHGGFSKAAFDENGALIHVMERLAPADAGVALALITPAEALGIALDRNFPDAPVPALAHEQGAISTFAADPHFYQAPTVEMVVVAEGAYLEEGFLVVLWGAADNRLYHTVVNGTGDIVENELRTTYAVPPSSSCPAVGSAVTIPINWGMRKGPLSTPTGKCGKGPGLCTISGGSTGTITGAPCIKNGASWWLIDVPGQCAGYVRQDFFDCQASPPPPNNLPTANITTDKTSGDAPLTVNFDGTGSTDDGQIVSYEWDFDGNGTIDATGATASFTYQTSGTYTARLTVTDDEGGKDEATTVITVESPPPNIPPTAQIVSNKTSGDSPLPVTFDASGSTDSDGHIVSYDWDFEGDGTTVSAGAIASFTYQTAGNYSARLTVTDDDGATDDATIYIVVDNEPPTAVIAADKTSGDAPFAVTFSGVGSTDSDGRIVYYRWDFDGNGTNDDSSEYARHTYFTYETAGTYTARLTVYDNDGATDEATISILVDNPPPGLGQFYYWEKTPLWDNSNPTTIDGPGPGNAESPIGWLLGAQGSIEIQGNNVHAYLDRDADDAPDAGGTPIVDGEFLTNGDIYLQEPTTIENQELAIQNLFVHANRIHDELYRYGFVEGAGNFQDDNFGKGGLGSDHVLAEAQDGSAINTSSIATPADGQSPRMQMHLWQNPPIPNLPYPEPTRDGALDPDLIYHEYGHGLTWRMIGGMSGDVPGAAGEGIADAFALVSNDKGDAYYDHETFRDSCIADYAMDGESITANYPGRVRCYNYREKLGEFDPARGAHRNGEILAGALWKLWLIYDRDGIFKDEFFADLVGAMNFIAPGPDFFDVRDGLLAQAPASRDCLIWDAFAIQGMGVGGSMDPTGMTITESFERPATCPVSTVPIAVIHADPLTGPAPLTVVFDGRDSSDEGRSDYSLWLRSSWDFDDDGVTDATGDFRSFTFPTPGTYPVHLTVTDRDGEQDTATVLITVTQPTGLLPPTAVIAADKTSGDAPLTVNFDGTGSTDSDGQIVAYDWDFDDDGNVDATGATASFTYQTAGSYTARLTITDDDGAQGDATLAITATQAPVPEPPTAVIAADKTSGDAPLTVSFDGTGSTDSDGLIVAYDWDFDDDGTTDATGASASFTYQAEGTYTARLTVTDDDGATDDATTAISVNPAPQPGGCPAVGAAVIIPNNWGMRKGPASTPSGGCGKGPGICTISGGSTGTITGDPCVKSGANWWLISVPGQCEGYVRENYFACQ